MHHKRIVSYPNSGDELSMLAPTGFVLGVVEDEDMPLTTAEVILGYLVVNST